MILVYCNLTRDQHRVRSALPANEIVVITSGWEQMLHQLRDAWVAVILLPLLDEAQERRLREVGSMYVDARTPPVILLTRLEPENARRVRTASVDEVVWLREIDSILWPTIRRVGLASSSLRFELARSLRESTELPHPLRRALQMAATERKPIRSISELARRVGCGRSTLERQWRLIARDDTRWRLEDFLAGGLLIRALELKTPTRSWCSVADEHGTFTSTISRIARRLALASLRELESHPARIRACLLKGMPRWESWSEASDGVGRVAGTGSSKRDARRTHSASTVAHSALVPLSRK